MDSPLLGSYDYTIDSSLTRQVGWKHSSASMNKSCTMQWWEKNYERSSLINGEYVCDTLCIMCGWLTYSFITFIPDTHSIESSADRLNWSNGVCFYSIAFSFSTRVSLFHHFHLISWTTRVSDSSGGCVDRINEWRWYIAMRFLD